MADTGGGLHRLSIVASDNFLRDDGNRRITRGDEPERSGYPRIDCAKIRARFGILTIMAHETAPLNPAWVIQVRMRRCHALYTITHRGNFTSSLKLQAAALVYGIKCSLFAERSCS